MTDILQEFDEWLKENTILNEKSRLQYVLQIKKFYDIYKELNLDNITKFLFLRKVDRVVYSRRYAV